MVSDDVVPLADLRAKVCDSWRAHGIHKDPADPVADSLILHLPEGASARDVAALAGPTSACERTHAVDGATTETGVFWTFFSVR